MAAVELHNAYKQPKTPQETVEGPPALPFMTQAGFFFGGGVGTLFLNISVSHIASERSLSP